LEGTLRFTRSDWTGPVNIGSDEMVTINQLADMAMEIAGKKLNLNHVPGPLGVRGRNSDNNLIYEKLGWRPSRPLKEGMEKTYAWIEKQVGKTEDERQMADVGYQRSESGGWISEQNR
jgi:nucleoside-diphosphate-sugar epimerase